MLDVIVPVYNEGGNIRRLLERIDKEISIPKRVTVVYDFDEDNTVPAVEAIRDEFDFPVELKKNIFGRGALKAIKTGLTTSEEDVLLVVMADLSDSLDVADTMYAKITGEGYKLVCGSRYMKGGKQFGGPFLKGLFSRVAGISLHLLTRIPTHDISNSFKMYHRDVIKSIEIESDGGFEIGMEITVKAYANGYAITEVPSFWYDRTEGESRFKLWSWIPKYLKWYFWLLGKVYFSRGGNTGAHSRR